MFKMVDRQRCLTDLGQHDTKDGGSLREYPTIIRGSRWHREFLPSVLMEVGKEAQIVDERRKRGRTEPPYAK